MSEAPYVTTMKIDPTLTLRFTWHGGEYIEVAEEGRRPMEVINVWNHATGAPVIERTQQALAVKAREWVYEYGVDALRHDVRENWYG